MGASLDNFPLRPSRRGEPTWEILDRFPPQGGWTVEDYFDLPDDGRLIEYDDGVLEVLPMPDWVHQRLAIYLWTLLEAIRVGGKFGVAILPPFNLHTVAEKYRHPDVMYLAPANLHRFKTDRWDYADLVIEIVSKNDPDRDYVKKRDEYAAAGVPEYWIVDRQADRITVLSLDGTRYRDFAILPLRSVVRSATVAEIEIDFAVLVDRASVLPGSNV